MNKIQAITLFTEAAFLAVSIYAPFILAKKDAIQIELNGSLDTLKKDWHRVNGLIRFLMFAPAALFAVLPAAIFGGRPFLAILLFISSLLMNIALHWILFDRELNRLRKKPVDYIGENADSDHYLKKNPNAKVQAFIVSCFAFALVLALLFFYL